MDIQDLLGKLFEQHKDDDHEMVPLFLMKDHPDIDQLFKDHDPICEAHEEKIEALKKEFKERFGFLEKTHEAEHERMWNKVYAIMKERGLYPEGYKPDDEPRMGIENDVMYFRKSKAGKKK